MDCVCQMEQEMWSAQGLDEAEKGFICNVVAW